MTIASTDLIGEVWREGRKLIFSGLYQSQQVLWEIDTPAIVNLPVTDRIKLQLHEMLNPKPWWRKWM